MPRIDFYVLPDRAENGRSLLACRLADKAYRLGHRVYIHTASAEQARRLDELLWTFQQGSFVPHALQPVPDDDLSPVLIGWGEGTDPATDLARIASPAGNGEMPERVLVNLTHEVPGFFERFERLVELVDQAPETLAKARDKFRLLRERGYSPASHQL